MNNCLIFLDFDGTLSALRPRPGRGLSLTRFRPSCMRALGWIVMATDAKIVISSTWRAFVHSGDWSLLGASALLKFGGGLGMDVIGVTRMDCGRHDTRGRQCRDWVQEHGHAGPYLALDDDDDEFAEFGIPLVQVDSHLGLTMADAERAITILRGDDDGH